MAHVKNYRFLTQARRLLVDTLGCGSVVHLPDGPSHNGSILCTFAHAANAASGLWHILRLCQPNPLKICVKCEVMSV